MNFLRVALFVIFLIAVAVWKQWIPLNIGSLLKPKPGTPSSPSADVASSESTSNSQPPLLIDGKSVISVASIRDAYIVDGDSIRWNSMSGPVEYRLASIDAPELSQPYGQRAKQYLQSIVAGKELTAYQTDVDQYGRRIAFFFATRPGHSDVAEEINAKMIADGYAWHAVKHSSNGNLNSLESNARAAQLGLWEHMNPVPPWKFRGRQQQQRLGSAKLSP
jgi:endonuclease YncB( thermonuclease family)